MKKTNKILAIFLMVVLIFQSTGGYGGVVFGKIDENAVSLHDMNNDVEEQENESEEIFIKAMTTKGLTTTAVGVEEEYIEEYLAETSKSAQFKALYGTTVRGGRHADKSATTGNTTIPREEIIAKWAVDADYSRRGYMEFNVPKDYDWETVKGIKLVMYLKEHFGKGTENIIQVFLTDKPSVSEENWTWNNTPELKSDYVVGEQNIERESQGEWVEIDVTDLKNTFIEDPNKPFTLGVFMKNIDDQGGMSFYSQYKDGGIYTPYLYVYHDEYKDKIPPKIEIKGVEDGHKVSEEKFEFEVSVSDNYDPSPQVYLRMNDETQQGVPGMNTVTLKKGINNLEAYAMDEAGNKSETLAYQIEYTKMNNYPVVQDTYIEKSNGDKVGENDKRGLLLKTPATGNGLRRVFLSFDVSDNTNDYVREATLELNVRELMGSDRSSEVVQIYEVPDFDASVLTWNNAPDNLGEIAEVSYQRNSTGKISLDITRWMNERLLSGTLNTTLNLALEMKTGHDQKGIFLTSQELDGSKAPELYMVEGLPAPILEVSGIEEQLVYTSEVLSDVKVVGRSVSDAINVDVVVKVNGTAITGKGNALFDIPLKIGENRIEIIAKDQEGNVTTAEYTVTRLEAAAAGVYYVDSVYGNDGNDGQSEMSAWKSLEKLNNIYFQPGTKILFKDDGVWMGQFKPKGSGTVDAPIIVDTYGKGESRPIINGNGISKLETGNVTAEGAVHLYNVSYWEINNLEVTNSGDEILGADRAGIMAFAGGAGNMEHIYIKNVYVHDVDTHCDGDKLTGGIIFLGDTRDEKGRETGVESAFVDILVEDSHIRNVAIEGLRTKNYASGTNTGRIKSQGVVFRNNLIEDIHGDGIVMAEIDDGGLAEKNIVRRHSICPKSRNYAGLWLYQTDGVLMQYNEVYDGVHGYNDGEAFDFDIAAKNNTYQYNYSYNNRGGLLLTMRGAGVNNIFRYNVSQNDGQGNEIFFCMNNRVKIYNNTIYVGEEITLEYFIKEDNIQNMFFKNNIVYVDGTVKRYSRMNGNHEAPNVSHNLFYPETLLTLEGSPNSETQQGLLTEDPMLVNPTGGNVVMDTWTQSIWDENLEKFKVQEGSPAINKGTVIDEPGLQDIYGTELYVDGQPDIGAHEFIVEDDGIEDGGIEDEIEDGGTEDETEDGGIEDETEDEIEDGGTEGEIEDEVEKPGSGSNSGSGSTLIRVRKPKKISVEEMWETIGEEKQVRIQQNFSDAFSYTILWETLSIEMLTTLTEGQFTDEQLQQLLENPQLLEQFGIKLQILYLNEGEEKAFSDVDAGHWAYDAIRELSVRGIAQGDTNDNFMPEQFLQTADTLTFLDRIFLLNPQANLGEAKVSNDVLETYITDTEHWGYYSMLSVGEKLSEPTVKVLSQQEEDYMSRELLAQVLYEMTDGQLEQSKDIPVYTDLESTPYSEAIQYCVSTGLLQGTSQTTMHPKKGLTRAEMATVLQRVDNMFGENVK